MLPRAFLRAVSLTGDTLPTNRKGRLTLKRKQKHRVAKPQNLTKAETEVMSHSLEKKKKKRLDSTRKNSVNGKEASMDYG